MDFMFTELLYDMAPTSAPTQPYTGDLVLLWRPLTSLWVSGSVVCVFPHPSFSLMEHKHNRPAVTPSSGAIATNYMFRRTAMYLWVRVLLSSFTIDTACIRHFPCSLATRTRSLANSVNSLSSITENSSKLNYRTSVGYAVVFYSFPFWIVQRIWRTRCKSACADIDNKVDD
ncbi:hypothetical protein BKA83DRAFT_2098515 [Pisolithus microcarpus]|nr:hypothetical protein BKA83DRAFT_2098515 [Pisolithus microcarpus]